MPTNLVYKNNLIYPRVSGTTQQNVRTVSANTTLTQFDSEVNVNTGAGGVTITLPTAPFNGQTLVIKKITQDANSLILSSAALIDGAATQTIVQANQSFTVVYDGVAGTWRIV